MRGSWLVAIWGSVWVMARVRVRVSSSKGDVRVKARGRGGRPEEVQ